jgi:Mesyanzhinovviridae DNA polymerase
MWEPLSISSLPSWGECSRVSVDTETYNPDIKKMGSAAYRDGYIVGYSFAFENGFSTYVPIRHSGGGNVDCNQAISYLRDQLGGFKGELIGANLKYDLGFLLAVGVSPNRACKLRDIQIADPLINELHFSYSLQSIAERWGFPGKAESILQEAAAEFNLDPKADIYQFHSQYVGPYAERDASLPLEIYRVQRHELDKQDLWPIFEIESRVLPAIVGMECRGVRVDLDKLEEVEERLYDSELIELSKIKYETGIYIPTEDIWKAKVILPLFQHLGIELPLTPTGKPSVAAPIISLIDNTAVQSLVHARKLNKLRTTFCESIKRFQVSGRIHCQYNQVRGESGGAAYGRMSCSKPNLQQIPKRTMEGSLIREIFVPDEGLHWASLDYGSQEPRILLHYANQLGLSGIAGIVGKLHANPRFDIHSDTAEKMGLSGEGARDHAKTIFLGLCYGSGSGLLAKQLGLPYTVQASDNRQYMVAGPEASMMLFQFHLAAPYIRRLSDICTSTAERRGYVKTLLGRRCRFPRSFGYYEMVYKALNRVCQGSAADQTKEAMAQAHEANLPIQVQIHDELTVSSELENGNAHKLQDIMINAVKLSVPTICDIKFGPSWGNLNN